VGSFAAQHLNLTDSRVPTISCVQAIDPLPGEAPPAIKRLGDPKTPKCAANCHQVVQDVFRSRRLGPLIFQSVDAILANL
jgi:hypothetical protein